jgi:hypothetical protein
MAASPPAPADAPPPVGAPPASSPARHLLTLIVDALQVPAPAPAGEAACLALVCRRSRAVLDACRDALAAPGDGGALYAARDLYDAVSSLPATYQRAPAPAPTRPASPGAPGWEHRP